MLLRVQDKTRAQKEEDGDDDDSVIKLGSKRSLFRNALSLMKC